MQNSVREFFIVYCLSEEHFDPILHNGHVEDFIHIRSIAFISGKELAYERLHFG
jgi:hypothetical protein